MEPDLPRYVLTSKCMTKWLTKADLRNSCKNTWNMHGKRDINRSQMFYSVYTKVTPGNQQRTSAQNNPAQSVSVIKLPVHQQKCDVMWRFCAFKSFFMHILSLLYIWLNEAHIFLYFFPIFWDAEATVESLCSVAFQ